jgi:NADH-ubiquinone oxidoreductase chain 2
MYLYTIEDLSIYFYVFKIDKKEMLISSLNLLLLSNAVSARRDKSILFSRVTNIIFIYCSLLLILNLKLNFLEKGVSLLGGLLFCKNHTQIFSIFLFILVIVILTLTSFYPRKVSPESNADVTFINNINKNYIMKLLSKKGEQFKLIEYPLIIIFVISGAIFLMASNDLITIFLSIELQSYGLYIICTMYRNSELSTNAGLTYFLLGGLSSCIILLGQGLLYANTGNTSLDSLYLLEDIFKNVSFDSSKTLYFYLKDYELISSADFSVISSHYSIQISLIIMSVGFLFKISAAPFHF